MPVRPAALVFGFACLVPASGLTGCGAEAPQRSRAQSIKEGTLLSTAGEEGEAGFGEVFLGPPNLDVFQMIDIPPGPGSTVRFEKAKYTIVVEVQADKFKWKNTAKKGAPDTDERIKWKAFGQVEK